MPLDAPEVRAALMPVCSGEARQLDIVMALAHLWPKQSDPHIASFFSQLMWFAGRMVDAYVMRRLTVTGDPTMADMSDRGAAKSIAKYGIAAQSTFHHQDVVHIALDASTVGKKPVTFAFMALATNVGAICPPVVVHGSGSTSAHLRRLSFSYGGLVVRASGARTTKRFWGRASKQPRVFMFSGS